MSRRSLPVLHGAVALALVPLVAGTSAAQNGPFSAQCAQQSIAVQDACQKSVDLFSYFAPQLGALVAGGNAELGRGGTLGGLGHVTVGLRANALYSHIPQLENVDVVTTGPQRSRVETQRQLLAFPVADAAIGLFKGIPIGLSRVGGIDALVNVAYVPNVTSGDVRVATSGGSLKWGFGARVGVLEESALIPGVSLSLIRRELPTTSVSVVTNASDRVGVSDARVRADSWRLAASKGLLFFRLAAGLGQDRYDVSARLDADVRSASGGAIPLVGVPFGQRTTRTNYFANVTLLNLPGFKLVGEIGRVQGGTLPATYNDFGGRRPDQAYTYGSAGVRVGG